MKTSKKISHSVIRNNKVVTIILSVTVFVVFSIIFILVLCKNPSLLSLPNFGNNTNIETTPITNDPYSQYPDIESLIGKTLTEVKTLYPDGEDVRSNTVWNTVWLSYRYENDLFTLYVDAKDTGIIDASSLTLKNIDGCKLNSTILDYAQEVAAYAHIKVENMGTATNYIGIPSGLASYYSYKQGYVLSVTCSVDLQNNKNFTVMLFKNPSS